MSIDVILYLDHVYRIYLCVAIEKRVVVDSSIVSSLFRRFRTVRDWK